jgi:hypothetical protein
MRSGGGIECAFASAAASASCHRRVQQRDDSRQQYVLLPHSISVRLTHVTDSD